MVKSPKMWNVLFVIMLALLLFNWHKLGDPRQNWRVFFPSPSTQRTLYSAVAEQMYTSTTVWAFECQRKLTEIVSNLNLRVTLDIARSSSWPFAVML